MKRSVFVISTLLILALLFAAPVPVFAQDSQQETPTATPDTQTQAEQDQPLTVFTTYPSRMVGFNETITVPLKLRSGTAQTVALSLEDLPEGWNSSFRGGSTIIDAVYLDGKSDASVDLRLEPPADVEAGEYTVIVVAKGNTRVELPLRFTFAEKLPPRLSLTVSGLATKRGTPRGTFTFTADLKNEGGEDLVVSLSTTQPENMNVTIESGGQEVTELELAANESKSLTIKASPLLNLEGGRYPFTVQATAGDVQASLDLTAEVVGEGNLRISTPDGRLSGNATAGRESPLKLLLVNEGTAALRGIKLSSSAPSGWSVSFSPEEIAEIPAGQSQEVTLNLTPPEKAIAGDYMVTINARPLDVTQKSAEFRITVSTSTLWGVAGIGLIAVAVAVVGMAVVRFGRR